MIAPCLIINAFWLGAQTLKIPMICFQSWWSHKRDWCLCFVIGHIYKGGRSKARHRVQSGNVRGGIWPGIPIRAPTGHLLGPGEPSRWHSKKACSLPLKMQGRVRVGSSGWYSHSERDFWKTLSNSANALSLSTWKIPTHAAGGSFGVPQEACSDTRSYPPAGRQVISAPCKSLLAWHTIIIITPTIYGGSPLCKAPCTLSIFHLVPGRKALPYPHLTD